MKSFVKVSTLCVVAAAAIFRVVSPAHAALLAYEPFTNAPGTAIIFSAPKSDSLSSNLNELRAPTSPFREMESTLQKPFEFLEPPKAAPRLKFTPQQQPELRKKTPQDILNQRAEDMFLEPNLHKGETDADFYNLGDESADLFGRKPKTALERYYDRTDRALTNRAFGPNPRESATDSLDPLSRNNLSPFAPDRELEPIRA